MMLSSSHTRTTLGVRTSASCTAVSSRASRSTSWAEGGSGGPGGGGRAPAPPPPRGGKGGVGGAPPRPGRGAKAELQRRGPQRLPLVQLGGARLGGQRGAPAGHEPHAHGDRPGAALGDQEPPR